MRIIFSILFFMSLFLPVQASDVFAVRTLRVGTILEPSDLRAANGAEIDGSMAIVGMEVRRAIYAGRRVERGFVGPPTLVKRNDIVVMHYNVGGLGIRTEGRAMSAGGEGEPVRVMNLDSRLTVRAIVRAPRMVEVIR